MSILVLLTSGLTARRGRAVLIGLASSLPHFSGNYNHFHPLPFAASQNSLTNSPKRGKLTASQIILSIWAYSSAGSASVSLLCPTELWAFKWGVCRLVAQPSHAPKYGPIAQLGERSVRIREVKGSNPSRSTNLPHRFVRCGVFYA